MDFKLTTGRKVILSAAVPSFAGYLLSLIEFKHNISRGENWSTYSVSHLYNYQSAVITFAALTFAFLWVLWGESKPHNELTPEGHDESFQ